MGTLYSIISDSKNLPDHLALEFGINPDRVKDKESALKWAYEDLFTPIGLAVVHNRTQQDVCDPLNLLYNDSTLPTHGSAYPSLKTFFPALQSIPQVPISPAWMWQACRELGYFQSTYPVSGHPFAEFKELTADFLFQEACQDFGVSQKPSTDQANRFFDGLKTASNIGFVQGRSDPW